MTHPGHKADYTVFSNQHLTGYLRHHPHIWGQYFPGLFIFIKKTLLPKHLKNFHKPTKKNPWILLLPFPHPTPLLPHYCLGWVRQSIIRKWRPLHTQNTNPEQDLTHNRTWFTTELCLTFTGDHIFAEQAFSSSSALKPYPALVVSRRNHWRHSWSRHINTEQPTLWLGKQYFAFPTTLLIGKSKWLTLSGFTLLWFLLMFDLLFYN